MSILAYGLRDNSLANNGSSITVAGPWSHTINDVQDIATITASVNVVGFVDGSNRAKYFYSSAGAGPAGAVALPTLSAVPNALPQGAIPLGTAGNGFVFVVAAAPNNSGGFSGGMLYFQVTPANGGPDAGSPTQYSLDPYGLLLVSTGTSQWL